MSVPILTFFNNKGGVGKTSLAYHVSWMLAAMGKRVVACDLDPQANLTSGFIDEDAIEQLWDETNAAPTTIFRCVQPLLEVGDLRRPDLRQMALNLALVPGDLALAGFEDALSEQWPQSMGETNLYRPFRALTAFWQVAQDAAKQFGADLVLMDVGPNLGAINRSALIASSYVVIPLAADLYSLQGLRNLGPTLRQWRTSWGKRLSNWAKPQFDLPQGRMDPIGYVAQQHGVRLSRPVKAYDRWLNRIPSEYRRSVLGEPNPRDCTPAEDGHCLATLKHYRSLVPMGQEARKPIFELTAADGAIGAHAVAVQEAYAHFEALTRNILERMAAAS